MGKHYKQFDLDERTELSRHHDAGKAPSEIARIIGRHRSTIGRELKRNSLPKGGYKPGSERWHHLCVSAIATEAEDWRLPDGRRIHRFEGEALDPPHEDRAALRERLLQIEAEAFAARYQQSPLTAEGRNRTPCRSIITPQRVRQGDHNNQNDLRG